METNNEDLCAPPIVSKVTQFTILGERCSGTNYVEKLISKNFDIDLTWDYGFKDYSSSRCYKHFFGFSDDYADNVECDKCLFVCIVRDPYEWIGSLFRNPFHLNPKMLENGWDSFLTAEFCSFYDKQDVHGEMYGKERMGDRNLYTKQRYKDIFEARKVKLTFLYEEMPKLVKHCIFVKYEDVRDNTLQFLKNLQSEYCLKRKIINDTNTNAPFIDVKTYKGQSNNKKLFKPIIYKHRIPKVYCNKIKECIDWDIENVVGYFS